MPEIHLNFKEISKKIILVKIGTAKCYMDDSWTLTQTVC